jgi:hypothetical protein
VESLRSVIFIKSIEHIPSTFIISCSIFVIYPPLVDSLFQTFFFDLTDRLFGLAAADPEPLNLIAAIWAGENCLFSARFF